jgi:putative endonuclease
MSYYVYVLRPVGILRYHYTGIATDVERRIAEHGTAKGAKCLRRYKHLELVWKSAPVTRSKALRIEAAIKKLSWKEKLAASCAARNRSAFYRIYKEIARTRAAA